jgi:hypothetical protein
VVKARPCVCKAIEGIDEASISIVYSMKYWWENLKERDQSEGLGEDGKVLELILGKYGGKIWTVCICIRIGTSGGLL